MTRSKRVHIARVIDFDDYSLVVFNNDNMILADKEDVPKLMQAKLITYRGKIHVVCTVQGIKVHIPVLEYITGRIDEETLEKIKKEHKRREKAKAIGQAIRVETVLKKKYSMPDNK